MPWADSTRHVAALSLLLLALAGAQGSPRAYPSANTLTDFGYYYAGCDDLADHIPLARQPNSGRKRKATVWPACIHS